MKKIMLAAALGAAMIGTAGIGHNMPPASVSQSQTKQHAVLPRRIVDENRRNQKLKAKLRRRKRRQYLLEHSRFTRKARQKGFGYHPGKAFKGHRI